MTAIASYDPLRKSNGGFWKLHGGAPALRRSYTGSLVDRHRARNGKGTEMCA